MMNATRISCYIKAPRADVYRALVDAQAVALWMVPDGMAIHVHAFDAREDGAFCISLIYDTPGAVGKTSEHTDTYRGRFIKLVPDELVVEMMAFETDDPAMRGEMTVTYMLTDADSDGGTYVLGMHDNLPSGISAADNENGWRMALNKLAALVEGGWKPKAGAS
jgi:uncharacterized protein YndB with AHSA1/START domain